MQTLNVHEAKTKLSAVLADIERTGAAYVICRNGTPVADIMPHRRASRLATDPFLKRVKVKCDLTKPLTPRDWEASHGA